MTNIGEMTRYIYPIKQVLKGLILLFCLSYAPQVGAVEEAVSSKPSKRKYAKTPAQQFAYANRLRDAGSRSSASKVYRKLVKRWPESYEAPFSQFGYAQILEQRGKLRKAFDAYQLLMERYAGKYPHYHDVLQRQFDIAIVIMKKKRGGFIFFDGFESPERAIPLLEKIVQNGPQWKGAPEAQYLIGRAQEEIGEYELAVVAYLTCQNRYPSSVFAEKSAYRRAHSLYQLSKSNPYSNELLDQAWNAISVFYRIYPVSEYLDVVEEYRKILYKRRAKVSYKVATFYDTIAIRPKAALLAYENFLRQYPGSEWAPLAQMRIETLSQLVEGENEK